MFESVRMSRLSLEAGWGGDGVVFAAVEGGLVFRERGIRFAMGLFSLIQTVVR